MAAAVLLQAAARRWLVGDHRRGLPQPPSDPAEAQEVESDELESDEMEGDDYMEGEADFMEGDEMSPSGRRTPTWYAHT